MAAHFHRWIQPANVDHTLAFAAESSNHNHGQNTGSTVCFCGHIMDALILWLLLLKLRITAMATTQGVLLTFISALFICVLQGVGDATFEIQNNCPFTVLAVGSSDSSSGGERLESGQLWTIQVPNGTTTGRFWGRTGCSFNANGRGNCNTGDCGGLLNCQGSGNTPATMVEYSLNQYQNNDFYDISVVDGFNLPISIIPSNPSCNVVACSRNISAICPGELRVSGGCDSAYTRFNTPQYCCTGEYSNNCGSTNYSRIFKRQCPQAYSYAKDDNVRMLRQIVHYSYFSPHILDIYHTSELPLGNRLARKHLFSLLVSKLSSQHILIMYIASMPRNRQTHNYVCDG